jgi:hypothetical protein
VLLSHTGVLVSITLTIPVTAYGGIVDAVVITTTSQLSSSVYDNLMNTTTVLYGAFLPAIRRE